MTVDAVMTRNPKIAAPDMLASTATGILSGYNISALVVAEKGKPVGIVHFHDLLRIGVV
jgi:arabinose-5-phosphate isomerase